MISRRLKRGTGRQQMIIFRQQEQQSSLIPQNILRERRKLVNHYVEVFMRSHNLSMQPQNILLDEDFCPKISDFGLAKICQRKDSIMSISGTRGTIGYMAPEIFSRAFGGVSYRSDVYSYGMLILEMIGGRKNYDTGGSCSSEMYFPDWIYKDLEQGNTLSNCSTISEEENDMVRKITLVSLWCIQTKPSDTPPMNKVIEMLQGPLSSLSYPPKPVLYSPERPELQVSDMSSSDLYETNSVTVSK